MKFIMLRAIATKLNNLMPAIKQGAAATSGLARRVPAPGESLNEDRAPDSMPSPLFENAFDAIITINTRHEIVAANTSALRLFGGALSMPAARVDRFISWPGSQDGDETRGITRLLATRNTWVDQTNTVMAISAHGRHIPAEMRIVEPKPGKNSELFLILSASTENEELGQRSNTNESLCRDLLENMPDGVFRCRRDGTILASNQAMVRLLGYSSQDELKRQANVQDLFLFPEQLDELNTCLDELGQVRDTVIEVYRKDLTERTVRVDIFQIPGGPGQETILQGTVRDLTEQPNEEHIRTVAANALDLLTIVDDNAKFIYCSPSCTSILGYEPEDMCGKSAFDLVHPDDIDALSYFIIETFREPGTHNTLIFRCQRRDGTTAHMESLGTAFVGRNGHLRGVINMRDVTRRLIREHQHQQAQKLQALGQLAGGIAHDFNNQLTAIVGCLQMIDDSTPASGVSEQVTVAIRAAMRGSALTKRLLGYAQSQPLNPEIINVGDLITGMEPMLRQALGTSMEIDISCDDDLWPVEVDTSQLEGAIFSLAMNARDASNAQGPVHIEIRNRDGLPTEFEAKLSNSAREYIHISVCDEGRGMSEETRRRATEPFFTTKTNLGASGLGLSMVYGFTRQSEGFLRIRNRHQQGARVDILLPRASEPPHIDLRNTEEPELPRGSETVLVVDDDADVREATIKLISRLGYSVLSASTGAAALKVLAANHVDLLFTDVQMPGMTGFELANETRTDFPQLRILLTSGFAGNLTLPTDTEQSDFHFLPKPYNRENLAKRIRAALDEP